MRARQWLMAKKEVPGLVALPTAAAAAAGKTVMTVNGYMPEITKKELKKLKYKVKERSWDGFDYYVVSWE